MVFIFYRQKNIQVMKQNNVWKIINFTDSRRENCLEKKINYIKIFS